MKLYKYPSTDQFRSVVKYISDNEHFDGIDENGKAKYKSKGSVNLPTIRFHGTVKLHGTNASDAYNKDTGFYCQSRNGVIK